MTCHALTPDAYRAPSPPPFLSVPTSPLATLPTTAAAHPTSFPSPMTYNPPDSTHSTYFAHGLSPSWGMAAPWGQHFPLFISSTEQCLAHCRNERQTSEASLCEAKGAKVGIKGFLPAYPSSYWIPLAMGSSSVFDLTYEGASVLLVVVLKCRWNELRPCKCWWTTPRPCRASGYYEAGGDASWLESHCLWDSKMWRSRQWSFVQEVSRWWKAGQTVAEGSLRGVMGKDI